MRRCVATILGAAALWAFQSHALDASEISFDSEGTHLEEDDLQSAIEALDERLLGSIASFESFQRPEPSTDTGWSILQWAIPSTTSATFQRALTANDANGAWSIVDNILCTSYNQLGRCTGGNRDASEHSFNFNLELSYQPTTPASELIEQNLNLFPPMNAGWWRPWAFHIAQMHHTSSWNVERGFAGQAFELNKNGNVQIGFAMGAPSRALHVVGGVEVREGLDVTGPVTLNGRLIRAMDDSSRGILLWGNATDTPAEVCMNAGYECLGAFAIGGGEISCAEPSAGVGFHARCGCSDDADGDGLNSCIDRCPLVADETNSDLDGDGLGDACDPVPEDPCNFIGALARSTEVLAAYQDNSCEDWSDLVQTESNLQSAILQRVDLFHAILDGSDLTDAMMGGARLVGASLIGCQLNGVDLDSADLTSSTFVGASLEGANLNGAVLTATNLTDAVYDENTIFPSGSDYSSAPWGLDGQSSPWDARMIPAPEPGLDRSLLLGVIGTAYLVRRRR